MSVVSRNAVPLLPMQLARSFAVRTESELLRYLANAQFLGLAGLWQKLCTGLLPARCDKAWYFATFCGIEGAEFERRALGVLDERADILGFLNGFVKPYDVIAALTVLSTTSGWFSPNAEVIVNGTAHMLLLEAEHAMDVRSVHNLLRETYHSVALLDADARHRRRFPLSLALLSSRRAATVTDLPANRAPLPPPHEQPPIEQPQPQPQPAHEQQQPQPQPLQPREPRTALRAVSSSQPPANARPSGVRASANVLSVLPRASSSASAARMASVRTLRASSTGGGALTAWRRPRVGASRRFVPQARVSAWWPHGAPYDAQLRRSMERLSAATVVNMLHADRLRSADGAASHELTAELLARAVDEAHMRQMVVMLRVAVITAFLCTGALAVVLTSLVPADASRRDTTTQPAERGESSTLARPASVDAVVLARARTVVLTFGFGATGSLILLCFHASAQQRVRILAAGLFGLTVLTAATTPWLATIVRLALRLAAGAVPVGARGPSVLVEMFVAVLQVLVIAVCVVRGLVLFWRHRADAHKLLRTSWSSLTIVYVGTSAVGLAEFVARAAGVEFSSGLSGSDEGPSFLTFLPVPANALFAVFSTSPRLQRRAQALIARPGSGMQGVVASLAPLVGYGSIEGERDTVELQAEARGALRGILLDSTGLDALGAAWAIVKRRRAPSAPPAGARERSSAARRALQAARALAASAASRSATRQSRGSTVPRASEQARGPWVEDRAATGGAARRAPSLRAPRAPRSPPAAPHAASAEEQLDALARAYTAAVNTYDCYIVHDEYDDARIRMNALRRFVRQFERVKGRPPVAFVATLCNLPSAHEPSARLTAVSSGFEWPSAMQSVAPPNEARSSGDGEMRDAWLAVQQAWRAARPSQPPAVPSGPPRVSTAGSTSTVRGHAAAFRSLEHLPAFNEMAGASAFNEMAGKATHYVSNCPPCHSSSVLSSESSSASAPTASSVRASSSRTAG